MSDWYYVLKGERKGPVKESDLEELISQKSLLEDDYVWKKGFENWKKLKDVPELTSFLAPEEPNFAQPDNTQNSHSLLTKNKTVTNLKIDSATLNQVIFANLDQHQNQIFIRIGEDRNQSYVDYGPYSVSIIKKLLEENRINEKTLFFIHGMKSWMQLANISDFEKFFQRKLSQPPQAVNKRKDVRNPFVAHLFVASSNKVFDGICRDISVGGMQVLVDHFPGKMGDEISINVHPENSDFQFVASGIIVRILEGDLGFSFRFSNLSNEAKMAIDKYLSRV